MKNRFISAAIAATTMLAVSCTEERTLPANDIGCDVEVAKLNNADAQRAFARILSKAVSNSEDVRAFLRTEALAQFDNDYDVFYPFVKDKAVAGGKTFRDMLLSYCDDEAELVQIEESSLLLNILVPDLTLFWEFDAEKWDTSDGDVAVICRDDTENTLYVDGDAMDSLPSGEIPGFPCLVVKNNERMVVKGRATRASDASYEFLDDVYDRSKTEQLRTRGRKEEWWTEYPEAVPQSKPYATAKEAGSLAVEAYEKFSDEEVRHYQREYVYYEGFDKIADADVSTSRQAGKLRPDVEEQIFMFKVSANKFASMSDEENDPKLQHTWNSPGGGSMSGDEIVDMAWGKRWIDGSFTGGKFEFIIKTWISNKDGSVQLPIVRRTSAKGSDLFALTKVYVRRKHKTAFQKRETTYFTSADLTSKWVHFGNNTGFNGGNKTFLPHWDLSETSLIRYIEVYEGDEEAKVKTTRHGTNEFVSKGDNYLGGTELSYHDAIIVGKSTDGNGRTLYELHPVSTGVLQIVFIPRIK